MGLARSTQLWPARMEHKADLGRAFRRCLVSHQVWTDRKGRLGGLWRQELCDLVEVARVVGGGAMLSWPPSRIALVAELRTLEARIAQLIQEGREVPKHVPLSETGEREAPRLQQKEIVDRIKITANSAEEWLLERLLPHYDNPHDVRDLFHSFAQLSGEIKSTGGGGSHHQPRPAVPASASPRATRTPRRPQPSWRPLPRHRSARHL